MAGFFKSLSLAAILLLVTSSCDAKTQDITVEYFGTVLLSCLTDGDTINTTQYKIFWITANAKVLDSQNPVLPKVWLVNSTTINVTKVDDDQFGYYTCVMVPKSNGTPAVMRWGVNIDGADFTQLEAQYRDSAIIGAIAAAVMLVLVGGACVIWHFRYSKRAGESGRASIEEDLKADKRYQNEAFDSGEMVETRVDSPDDKANGTPASNDKDGPQNARM